MYELQAAQVYAGHEMLFGEDIPALLVYVLQIAQLVERGIVVTCYCAILPKSLVRIRLWRFAYRRPAYICKCRLVFQLTLRRRMIEEQSTSVNVGWSSSSVG